MRRNSHDALLNPSEMKGGTSGAAFFFASSCGRRPSHAVDRISTDLSRVMQYVGARERRRTIGEPTWRDLRRPAGLDIRPVCHSRDEPRPVRRAGWAAAVAPAGWLSTWIAKHGDPVFLSPHPD